MNQKKSIAIGALLLSAVFGDRPVRADVLEGIGPWHGSGTLYSADGLEQGSFKVKLVRTALDAQTVQTRGTVTFAGGQSSTFEQQMTRTATGFSTRSPRGQGSGHCFGVDLCHASEDAGNGQTSTTTMVVDGPNRVRVLVTQYENGAVAQFLRETLIRE